MAKVARLNPPQGIKRQGALLRQNITRLRNIIVLHLVTTMNIIKFTIITADITPDG
ncbi:MAG: hypothetical protein IKJ45_04970 [Kiritimatiellae bacterium]|nr:hypothetical protein [Kiritimatiellia bacterium]